MLRIWQGRIKNHNQHNLKLKKRYRHLIQTDFDDFKIMNDRNKFNLREAFHFIINLLY